MDEALEGWEVYPTFQKWFGNWMTVLCWNIKFNKKPPKVPKPKAMATKGIAAVTLVIEQPALVLFQEVGWVPVTGSGTWIENHLIGWNKVGDKCDCLPFSVRLTEKGETFLKNYGICPGQASTGDLRDVYIMYRKDLLQEEPTQTRYKSLMQHFSELLLKAFKAIMKRRHLASADPETLDSIFKKILGQAVCMTLRSKMQRPGERPVKFLAMSVHMPYKGFTMAAITEFGRATLRAACRLAKKKRLPLIIGGDWNVAVSMVHDAYPDLFLLNRDHKRIDGVFMYCANTTDDVITLDPRIDEYISSSETYEWNQRRLLTYIEAMPRGITYIEAMPRGIAAALVEFSEFASYCYKTASNHLPILVTVPRYGTLAGSDKQILVDFL